MNREAPAPRKILTGNWGDDIVWEFYVTEVLPPAELCTSVMCVPLLPTYEVVMTHNHRGWELPGGHIEPNETIEQALLRELQEEAGYIPEKVQLFGYRQIRARTPIPHAQQAGFYPFPITYIPYYVTMSGLPLEKPSGSAKEIFEAKEYSVEALSEKGEEFRRIAEEGIRAFQERYAS